MLEPQIILNAADATGWGTPVRVGGYKHVVLIVATDGLGVGETITVKVAHSYENSAPDFSAAKSISNTWSYVQTYDLNGGAGILGSTGKSISGADDVVHLEINQNAAEWINVEVSTIAAGTVTVKAVAPERT